MNEVLKTYLMRSLLAVFFLCVSCKVHILDAKYVSMTTDELPVSEKKGESIAEKWCIDEAPKEEELLLGPGYLDRVVLKAQKKHQAKYFADVSFYQQGTCAHMQGNIVK